MLVIQISRHCPEQILARRWELVWLTNHAINFLIFKDLCFIYLPYGWVVTRTFFLVLCSSYLKSPSTAPSAADCSSPQGSTSTWATSRSWSCLQPAVQQTQENILKIIWNYALKTVFSIFKACIEKKNTNYLNETHLYMYFMSCTRLHLH